MRNMQKSNKKRISVTLQEEVFEKVESLAVSQYRSVSAMINWLCRKAVGMHTEDTNIEEIE